jgi:uncharacterized peroxidase-related enzyme
MTLVDVPLAHPLAKNEAAPHLQDAYQTMAGKFGHMPNIFAVMAHHPAALTHFLALYESLMAPAAAEGSPTGLARRDKELVYLKTAMLNGCEYWTRAHTASARQAGITPEQIGDLLFYESSDAFDARDKLTLLYTERVTRDASGIREDLLQEMRGHYSEQQLVELTLVICVANFTNRFNDALRIAPDLGWKRPPRIAGMNSWLA